MIRVAAPVGYEAKLAPHDGDGGGWGLSYRPTGRDWWARIDTLPDLPHDQLRERAGARVALAIEREPEERECEHRDRLETIRRWGSE